jgi:hypothetical protein
MMVREIAGKCLQWRRGKLVVKSPKGHAAHQGLHVAINRQAIDLHQAPLPADASIMAQIRPLFRLRSRERDDPDRQPRG